VLPEPLVEESPLSFFCAGGREAGLVKENREETQIISFLESRAVTFQKNSPPKARDSI